MNTCIKVFEGREIEVPHQHRSDNQVVWIPQILLVVIIHKVDRGLHLLFVLCHVAPRVQVCIKYRHFNNPFLIQWIQTQQNYNPTKSVWERRSGCMSLTCTP